MVDRKQILLIQETAKSITETTNKISRAIVGKILSAELLAQTLSSCFSDLSKRQLEKRMEKLLEGIKTGRNQFGEINFLSEDELEEKIFEKLEHMLEDMSEEKQRQLLILIYQSLCEETGIRVESNMAIYISNLSTKQMIGEVITLIDKERDFLIDNITEILDEYLESQVGITSNLAEDVEHTEEEKNWILAVSAYVTAENLGVKILDLKQLGEQVGYECSFMEKFCDVMKSEVLSSGLMVIVSACLGIVSMLLVKYILVNLIAAYLISFTQKFQSWRMIQLIMIVAVIQAMGYTIEKVYTKALRQKGVEIAYNAQIDLEQYVDEIQTESYKYVLLTDWTGKENVIRSEAIQQLELRKLELEEELDEIESKNNLF